MSALHGISRFSRAALPCLLFALGCSDPPPPIEYDASIARTTLLAALDAWKQGQAGALGRRDPPIRFVDEDWIAGWQLTEYQFADPAAVIEPFADVQVELVLRNTRGQTVRRKAAYQVALSQGLSVLRSEP